MISVRGKMRLLVGSTVGDKEESKVEGARMI